MKGKRIIALFCSAVVMLSSAASASAEMNYDIANDLGSRTCRIGEYDCFKENGQYYTIQDGEKYLVVNLDECTKSIQADKLDEIGIQSYEGSSNEINIVNNPYNGYVDISNGDCTTPTFVGREAGESKGFKLTTGFVLPNTYSLKTFVYNAIYNRWDIDTDVVTFGLLAGQSKVLFTGTMARNYTKLYIVFQKNGSTGESKFNYTLSET